MPSLRQIGDPTELDNLYSGKTIVYVEGTADLAFFNDLVGPDMFDRLEFKVPEEGTGYHQVKKRVAGERPRNKRIHGLLDGEAAVAFGHFDEFLVSDGTLFAVEGPEMDGLLFLPEHELENLVLCHVDIPTFVAQNVPFTQIGSVSAGEIRAELVTLAKRFYLLALLKFAAGRLHAAGTPCKVVDEKSGMFVSKVGVAKVMRTIKPKIIEAGIAWSDFIDTVREFAASVMAHFKNSAFEEAQKQRHVLRMADGKSMLKRVRANYSGPLAWEGLLQGRLKGSDYAPQFVESLELATDCNK
jgi:hypothetical protein